MEILRQYLPLLLPVVVIELVLMIAALVDLLRRKVAARNGSGCWW